MWLMDKYVRLKDAGEVAGCREKQLKSNLSWTEQRNQSVEN